MTHRYLLDTNALIALRDAMRQYEPKSAERQQRIDRIRQRCQQIPAEQLAMSFVSLGELSVWAEKSVNPVKAREILQKLLQRVRAHGASTGAEAGQAQDLAQRYAQVRVALERQGQVIGTHDTWIAAHALVLGLTVVTNNTREFGRVPGLLCEDWTV